MNIDVYHNILWSKYKGGVFSELHKIAEQEKRYVRFVQIAETEGDRVGLSGVDMSYHRYPHKLLFNGVYGNVPLWRLMFALMCEVLASKADLIILPGYHRPEYWAMLFACMLRRKKRAVFCDSTAYDRPSSFPKTLAKRLFFYCCDGYFGYGLRSREYLLSLGAKQERIFHRCQAAAMPHDYAPEKALSARLANAVRYPGIRFLYAGRLSGEKGLDTLLKAFVQVLMRLPQAKLVLVGAGPLREELEALACNLGINGQVEFAGGMSIDALAQQYAMATCFVLPSRSEPWGLVINEALSYGCPVVVSNVCGCVPELVIDGVTGYAFEVDDVAGLAQCMMQVAETFIDTETVAKRCLDLIATYSPERAAQQILDGSKIILKGRSHA